ncbi:MAG: alanine/glycine:cation symporter family protein [Oscillospiraceae bacterium]
MELLVQINDRISAAVWGAPTIILILFTGGLFSVKTGFFQLTHFRHWIKSTLGSLKGSGKAEKGSVSQFSAMTSALAATLGTGNIAGVSAAVAAGGAGAVFWMWVSALFGMMTGFAENVLGIYYRKRENGVWRGGAMQYISTGLSETKLKPLAKPLAAIFAGLCVLASFGMGNMAQMNSASGALLHSFGIPTIVSGIVMAGIGAAVSFGGVKRIASVTAALVPFMSIFYFVGAAYILVTNAERIPSMLVFILEEAICPRAVAGGVSGYIIRQAVSMGIRRGVFSNEAGLGTSVAAHAASDVREPCVQGMWSIFEVFFDTIVMCSLTAFILLCSPCRAITFDEALCSVSTQTQYFCLVPDEGIITHGTQPPITDSSGEKMTIRTVYGTEFSQSIGKGSLNFSNIMTIRGVQSTDSSGNLLYTENGSPLIESIELSQVSGAALTSYAFRQSFGGAAEGLLAVAITLFAFSTAVGWSSFGAEAAIYLFGRKSEKPYKFVFAAFMLLGSVAELTLVWNISDTLNGLMALPNLFAVLCLSQKVIRIYRNYRERVFGKQAVTPMLSYYQNGNKS